MLELMLVAVVFANVIALAFIQSVTVTSGGLLVGVGRWAYKHNLKPIYCTKCFAGWVALIAFFVMGLHVYMIPACGAAMWIFRKY